MSQKGMREKFDVNRRQLVRSLGVAGVAGLAGCAGDAETASETEARTETEPQTATQVDKDQVKMGGELIATFGANVKNYDPTQHNDTTSSKAFGLVYESLLATGFDGEPKPVLAKEVVQLDDDLMWRVNLREGVTFHNGNELTADDVKATFERYEGTPRESDVFDWYDSSTVQDDYTLDFKLQKPYAPLKFGLGAVPIVPKEVADGDLDLAENPVGTGPYRFQSHDQDSLFRLQRNEDYWFTSSESMPEKPPIETITFRIIVEQSSQLAALESGDVDMINNVPAESYEDLKDNEEITVTERTQGGFDLLAFPMSVEPFTSAKTRRGVSRLIPRDAIVKSVYQGIGTPAYSPISPLAKQFTSEEFNKEMGEKYLGFDTEKATQLLEEGFAEAGIEKPFETTIITNQNPQRVKWVQLITESLNSTEFFDVEIEQFEWNTYIGKILSGDAHEQNNLIAVGWSAGWDADDYVHNLFASEQKTPACCNWSHYESEKVDDLISEGLQTYDLDERKDIYQEMMETLCEDAPSTYIRYGKAMNAYRSDTVHGFNTYPIDSGEYKGVFSASAEQFTYVDK